ncbi:MAG: hypothetical protein IBX57_00365 [Gammaproteobacteria bacterium]|nr:hypothetical protein [Gammaproteobacteria bacterium]
MARALLKQYLVASLESDEPNPEEVEEVEEESGVESLEYATLEVEEAGEEVEEVMQDIEDLEEVEEGLEAIVADLEASLEQGGLDPVAAVFATHAISAYTARLGVESADLIPSVESFGGDTTRTVSTESAMDKVKDTIKKIWATIKAAMEKAAKAIADFFAKIFGGVKKLEARSKALKAKIAEVKKAGGKAGDIKVPNAATLAVGDKVDVKSITDGLTALNDTVKAVAGGYTDEVTKATESMPGLVAAWMGASEEEAPAKKEAVDKAYDSALASLEKVSGEVVSGNKTIAVKEGKVSLEAAEGKGFTGDASMTALSTAEMESVLKAVDELVDYMGKRKAAIDKLSKARQEVIKKLDAEFKKEPKHPGKDVNAVMKGAQKEVSAITSSVAGHAFSVARSALALVEVSANSYKAEDDKKEGEEKPAEGDDK